MHIAQLIIFAYTCKESALINLGMWMVAWIYAKGNPCSLHTGIKVVLMDIQYINLDSFMEIHLYPIGSIPSHYKLKLAIPSFRPP